jgi:hypothetical protein
MNHFTIRLLNLRSHGRHAADPLGRHGPADLPPHPVTSRAVAAGLHARAELTAQADIPTAVIPALNVNLEWPPAPPRESWLTVPQAQAMLPAVRYPDCGEYPDRAPVVSRDGYAAAMRHVGRITGTSSPYEDAGAWARPALEAPLPDHRAALQMATRILPGGMVI